MYSPEKKWDNRNIRIENRWRFEICNIYATSVTVARPLRHRRAIFAFYCCYKNVEIAVENWLYYIYIYMYIYVWKLNQTVLELDFRAVKFFVLPSTGFEPTPLIHCSTIRLALRPSP
jgi:hypothetical protein